MTHGLYRLDSDRPSTIVVDDVVRVNHAAQIDVQYPIADADDWELAVVVMPIDRPMMMN